MEAWEKFANELKLTDELEDIYFKLRLAFLKEGWTESDLKRPPYYPENILRLFTAFGNAHSKIRRTISEYGFDVDSEKLSKYLKSKLKHIDNDTPLRS
jgi:hypothetical protein